MPVPWPGALTVTVGDATGTPQRAEPPAAYQLSKSPFALARWQAVARLAGTASGRISDSQRKRAPASFGRQGRHAALSRTTLPDATPQAGALRLNAAAYGTRIRQ